MKVTNHCRGLRKTLQRVQRSFTTFWIRGKTHKGRIPLGSFSVLLILTCFSLITFSSLTPNLPMIAAPAEITEDTWKEPAHIVRHLELDWEKEFEDYFGGNRSDFSMEAKDIGNVLEEIGKQTQTKPAVLWAWPEPDQVGLVLITPGKEPVARQIKSTNQELLSQEVRKFRSELTTPRKRTTTSYLPPAQQLYDWLVRPFEAELAAAEVDTLMFCLGDGLRILPLAALHDGKQFLVEKYNITRIPAFNMIKLSYAGIRNAKILAMGASEFKELNPLPAVPLEVSSITKGLWSGEFFLNQAFTLENLKKQLNTKSFDIVHLATHAAFNSGAPNHSFIQLWDSQLRLDEMNKLAWRDPPISLLVLSACQTAVGNKEAELGFAGLAVQSGVRSALASLWSVSDAGTLALMTEFYQQLKTAPIKAEALRQAQLAMIKGKVRLEGGELRGSRGGVELPPVLANLENETLSHPFYWAAFTLIGSPW